MGPAPAPGEPRWCGRGGAEMRGGLLGRWNEAYVGEGSASWLPRVGKLETQTRGVYDREHVGGGGASRWLYA